MIYDRKLADSENYFISAVKRLIQSGWLFLLLSFPATAKDPIQFLHFGQNLLLQPAAQGYSFSHQGQRLAIELTNRLILKTEPVMTAASIQGLHPAIQQVQQLAVLDNTVLWLVHLTSEHELPALLLLLQQQKGVLYAQPDLQQQRQKAELASDQSEYQTLTPETARKPQRPIRFAVIDDGFSPHVVDQSGFRQLVQYDADLKLADASPKTAQDKHGDKVLSLVAQSGGLDPKAEQPIELISIRQVSSWTSDLVLAFAVARMMQADLVNSSWILAFLPEPLFDLLHDWSQQEQPYLVFAAGNNRLDACKDNAFSQLPAAIIVAALDSAQRLMVASNYGPCVDLMAPGTHQLHFPTQVGQRFNGTSAAAAYVSGQLLGLLKQNQKPDLITLQKKLRELSR